MTRIIFICMTLITLSWTITSCKGQGDPARKKEEGNANKSLISGHPKLIRSQGTNEYANVHCGIQDRSGNLWFGTTGEGVYRYDGKLFHQFTIRDGLNSNTVLSILEDRSGNIWLGTDEGICLYDGKTFSKIPITATSEGNLFTPASVNGKSSAKNNVSCMLQDKSGQLWFCASDGVYCYNGTSFSRFLDDQNVINNDKLNLRVIQSILQDKKGNIWFASWFEGLCCYDGKSITSFKPNGEVWYAGIFEDSKGNIWAGRRYKGVCRYDGSNFTNVLQNGIFDSSTIRPLNEDSSGNVWFGSELNNKGSVWSYDGGSFKNYNTMNGLGDYGVWCMVKDSTGNFWIGTRDVGLYRYDGKTFSKFSE